MVLIGGGRQKYMAAKGEWQQSCCQADCSLLRTRWPLRGSVVHSCLISLLIHTESLWARGRMVLMSVLNACKALHLLLDLYLMFTEKGLPLCYIIISFMSVWPQLLKIKNEWSSIHCNCSLSWILYAKIDTVLNVWNACGRQATASPHCGILVAQLLKYHRHLCTVFHNLPLPATLTVYCAVT